MNAITLCWLEPVCTGDTALCNGRNVQAGATLCNVCTPQWPSHNCQPCVSFYVFLVTPAHLAASGLVLVDRGITGVGLHDVRRHSAAIPGSHKPWPSCRTSWRCGIMFTHSNQVVSLALTQMSHKSCYKQLWERTLRFSICIIEGLYMFTECSPIVSQSHNGMMTGEVACARLWWAADCSHRKWPPVAGRELPRAGPPQVSGLTL